MLIHHWRKNSEEGLFRNGRWVFITVKPNALTA